MVRRNNSVDKFDKKSKSSVDAFNSIILEQMDENPEALYWHMLRGQNQYCAGIRRVFINYHSGTLGSTDYYKKEIALTLIPVFPLDLNCNRFYCILSNYCFIKLNSARTFLYCGNIGNLIYWDFCYRFRYAHDLNNHGYTHQFNDFEYIRWGGIFKEMIELFVANHTNKTNLEPDLDAVDNSCLIRDNYIDYTIDLPDPLTEIQIKPLIQPILQEFFLDYGLEIIYENFNTIFDSTIVAQWGTTISPTGKENSCYLGWGFQNIVPVAFSHSSGPIVNKVITTYTPFHGLYSEYYKKVVALQNNIDQRGNMWAINSANDLFERFYQHKDSLNDYRLALREAALNDSMNKGQWRSQDAIVAESSSSEQMWPADPELNTQYNSNIGFFIPVGFTIDNVLTAQLNQQYIGYNVIVLDRKASFTWADDLFEVLPGEENFRLKNIIDKASRQAFNRHDFDMLLPMDSIKLWEINEWFRLNHPFAFFIVRDMFSLTQWNQYITIPGVKVSEVEQILRDGREGIAYLIPEVEYTGNANDHEIYSGPF